MERISRPRKMMTRSLPDAISIIPTVANKEQRVNSPAGSCSRCTQTVEISNVRAETSRKTSVKLATQLVERDVMPLKAS
jgi:hypothetical protein